MTTKIKRKRQTTSQRTKNRAVQIHVSVHSPILCHQNGECAERVAIWVLRMSKAVSVTKRPGYCTPESGRESQDGLAIL